MKGSYLLGMSAAASALLIFAVSEASAQRGGGRGGGVRASSSGSISSAGRGGGANRSTTASRNTASANRNVNRGGVNNSGNTINTGDRNVNVNVDVDNDGWGAGYHPVARGAAVAATTAVVMGSYYSVLPAGCVTIVRVGINYSRCGSTWYRPIYSGNNVQYQVVAEP